MNSLAENQSTMTKFKVSGSPFLCMTTDQFGVNVVKDGPGEEKIEFTAWAKTKKDCLDKAVKLAKLLSS